MLSSMTGYGRTEAENENFVISIDLRAVNHKYLDIQVRAPYFFRFLEDDLKKFIKEYIHRGRIDVSIYGEKKDSKHLKVEANTNLAKKYDETISQVEGAIQHKLVDRVQWILAQENVLDVQYEEVDEEETKKFVLETLDQTLQKISKMQRAEGDRTGEDLVEKLQIIEEDLKEVEERSPQVMEELEKRIRQRIEELLEPGKIDEERILQEICYYSEKSDINEEIQRLRFHLGQFKETMENIFPNGKKLDFILQEMNREANTMSSKSNDSKLTMNILDIKLNIEKMREQVQNVQ